jgi:uncharacterized metal-binding protein
MSKENIVPDAHCAACPMAKAYDRRCSREDGKAPRDCPTVHMPEMAQAALGVYKTEEYGRMAKTAALVERAGYERTAGGLKPTRPRIIELVDFARRMGYKKLALLFCLGLRKEADIARKILETNKFEVISAICKVGCLPKSELGLTREEQLNPDGPESMCNPVMQAEIANEAGVDLNILLGLCVGHDSLVLAHVKAPATILAVKDRLMGHNPLAALYQYDVYYGFLHSPLFPDE